MYKVCVKNVLIAILSMLMCQASFAQMRDRVSITADNNVVTDKGEPLRGTPFFLDIFSIFETGVNGNVVGGMQANEALYREYFGRVVSEYNMNAIRISPWMGVWEVMQKDNQYYEAHKTEFLYMVDTVVDWAEEEGIYAIVNLHTRFGTDATLGRMKDFWDVFAPRYKNKTHVIYELTNEPKTQYWTAENIVQRRININNPNLQENNNPNTLIQTSMAPLYQHVRAIAPDTHLILWSPNNPSSLPLQDIIDNSTGIDYSNASVGFHIYEFTLDKKSQWNIADSYRDHFPSVLTEFYSLTHADNYPIDYAHLTTNLKTAQERGYSWIQWAPTANYANLNQKITHDEIKFSQAYKDAIENDMHAVFSNGNDLRNSQGTTIIVDDNGNDANGNSVGGSSSSVVRVNEAKTYWSNTPAPPAAESLNFSASFDTSIDLSGDISVPVFYVANQSRDLLLVLFDENMDTVLGHSRTNVPAGSGNKTLTMSANAPMAAGAYKLRLIMRPVGGNYLTNYNLSLRELTAGQVEESLSFAASFDTSVDLSGDISVPVSYATSESRDLLLVLFDESWDYVGHSTTTVVAGSGNKTLTMSTNTPLAVGTYNLRLIMRPVGGNYLTNYNLSVRELTASNGVTESLSFDPSFGTSINLNGDISVPVSYVTSEARDIILVLFDEDWNNVKATRTKVLAGSKNRTLNFSAGTLAPGTYNLRLIMRPVGGNYLTNYNLSVRELVASGGNSNSLEFSPAPSQINLSGNVSVTVNYESDANRDLVVEIFDTSSNWLGWVVHPVSAGSGTKTLNLSVGTLTSGNHQLKVGLRTPGGDWTTSAIDVYHTTNAQ